MEFAPKCPGEQFEKKYAYNVRYNYGREGRKSDYTPYSCLKIISALPGQVGCSPLDSVQREASSKPHRPAGQLLLCKQNAGPAQPGSLCIKRHILCCIRAVAVPERGLGAVQDQVHGCPYRVFSAPQLTAALSRMGLSGSAAQVSCAAALSDGFGCESGLSTSSCRCTYGVQLEEVPADSAQRRGLMQPSRCCCRLGIATR